MWPIIGMEGGHVICDYVLSRDLKVITVQVHKVNSTRGIIHL